MVRIEVDTRNLKKVDKELSKFPKEIPKATSAAIYRVVGMLKTEAKRKATEHYTIKSGDFAGMVKTGKDYVLVESRRLTLRHFKVKSGKSGILAQIKKDSAAKSFKGIVVPGIRKPTVRAMVPFRAGTGAAGADKARSNIFRRTGARRLPIEPIRTISAAQMISRPDVAAHLEKYGVEQLDKRIAHEVGRRLERMAKRASK